MILETLFKKVDSCNFADEIIVLYIFFNLVIVIACIAAIVNSFNTYGWFIFIPLLILSEIFYHSEPRSEKQKEKGRDYATIIFKKISSILDVGIIIAIFIAGQLLYNYITPEILITVAKYVGFVVITTGLFTLYILLNSLRDKPQPKKKAVKKTKSKPKIK